MAGKTLEMVRGMVRDALTRSGVTVQLVMASHNEARYFMDQHGSIFSLAGGRFNKPRMEWSFPNDSKIRVGVASMPHDVERFYGMNPSNWVLSRFLDSDAERRMYPLLRSRTEYIDPWEPSE